MLHSPSLACSYVTCSRVFTQDELIRPNEHSLISLQSYCLKIKEMDDEEYTFQALQEPLYRVETGNYEYRLILRCRQEAKIRFANMRADVLVKLELLDQKHVQDIVSQLQKLLNALAKMYQQSHEIFTDCPTFPLELDLSANCTFEYPDPLASPYQEEEEDEAALSAKNLLQDSQCPSETTTIDLLAGDDPFPLNSPPCPASKSNVDELLSLQ